MPVTDPRYVNPSDPFDDRTYGAHNLVGRILDGARSATAALYPEARIPETPMPSLTDLLHEAAGVQKICRQMCVDDGVDPDEGWVEAYGKQVKNWEHHVANVNAVLRAMRALAS